MDLPDDTPRLPKFPFLLGDVILLTIAAYLAYRAGDAPTIGAVVAIIICAGLGVAVGIVPFLLDYTRQQELQMKDRERFMDNLVRSTTAAAEQAGIAANGLNEIAETTKTNLRRIEDLPEQIKEARNQALKEGEAKSQSDHDALKAELAKLTKTVAALQKELKAPRNDTDSTLADKLEALQSAQTESLGRLEEKLTEIAKTAAPKPTKRRSRKSKDDEPAPEPTKEPKPVEAPPPETVAVEETASAPKSETDPEPETPSPTKEAELSLEGDWEEPTDSSPKIVSWDLSKTAPSTEDKEAETTTESDASEETSNDQKTKTTEEQPLNDQETVTEAEEEPEEKTLDEAPKESVTDSLAVEDDTADESSEIAEPEVLDEPAPEEPALSTDGNTRLTVTAYIGIGNRLFIRGEGPGLSTDEGVPLQFVSIGKWRWETDTATAPVKVTLWKNDEEECTSLGEIELAPGAQLETTANF